MGRMMQMVDLMTFVGISKLASGFGEEISAHCSLQLASPFFGWLTVHVCTPCFFVIPVILLLDFGKIYVFHIHFSIRMINVPCV